MSVQIDLTNSNLQNIITLLSDIKEGSLDVRKIDNIISLCRSVLSRRKSSLDFILPKKTTLELLYQDSTCNPSLYFDFKYFDVSIKICLDCNYISNNSLEKHSDSCYYHIETIGFKPSGSKLKNLSCYSSSPLKTYAKTYFGNFENLDDCLEYFRLFVFDCLIQNKLEACYGLL